MQHYNKQQVSGTVERVTFHSPESGFCVLRVKMRGQLDPITLTGITSTVNVGEFVEATGEWVRDSKYGRQFKADQLNIVPPTTREGMERYLASGMVKGIGPQLAKNLLAAYGERVFEIIEQHPEKLLDLDGIGSKRQRQITEAWSQQRNIRNIMVFLQSHGVGSARAVRIYKTYGSQSVERIRENPYRLALDILGIGFKTADTIALSIGISHEAVIRARAGIRFVLQQMTDQGDCAATRQQLLRAAEELLQIPLVTLEQALVSEIQAENLVLERVDGQSWVYLAPLFRAEQGIVSSIARLMQSDPVWGRIDAEQAVAWVQQREHLQLAEDQVRAVSQALNSKVMVITGGPGVGKTTVLRSLLRILAAKGVQIELCAPTGRAAKRMAESTGMPARTIHRMLEFDPKIFRFRRNRDRPLETQLLVVDEASMLDVVLCNQLLRAVPDSAAVIFVGDVDQLPSVGPGAVLHDLLQSGVVPSVRMDQVFRQARDSQIIVNAHRINRGQMPESELDPKKLADFYFIATENSAHILERVLEVVSERIPRRFGIDPMDGVQVLTPMNRGELGVENLNQKLQQRLNPVSESVLQRFGNRFGVGDKVIQTINNYDKDLFNGDMGRIEHTNLETGEVKIRFETRVINYSSADLDEINLAYATTVHKSQGSEYPAVVIPISTQHFKLLQRNLLYTAVTRGRRLVVVIGQVKALRMAVENDQLHQRLTHLNRRLRDQLASRQ